MLRLAATFSIFGVACSPEFDLDLPPIEYESRRARVGVSDLSGPDSAPCAADLDRIDQQIEFAEAQLGVERDGPLEVYLMTFDEIGARCSLGAVAGCYLGGDLDVVLATWQSLEHELVHAVARDISFSSLFWSEGSAEMLSGASTRKSVVPIRPTDFDANDLANYLSPTHLSRFLVETRGWPDYVRMLKGAPFAEVYGDPLELIGEYEEDAPSAYPPLDPCPYPDMPEIDDGRWREALDFSCESEGATQVEFTGASESPGPAVVRRLELAAGSYEFELQGGGHFVAIGCHTEQVDQRPEAPSNGDLFNELDDAFGTEFAAGDSHVLELSDGVYRIAIVGDEVGPTNAELAVTLLQ